MKLMTIAMATLALAAGVTLMAISGGVASGQEGSPTVTGTTTPDAGTTTPETTMTPESTTTPSSGGSLATTTPGTTRTSTPVAGGASALPSTGDGGASAASTLGVFIALGAIALAGVGAIALAGRKRA